MRAPHFNFLLRICNKYLTYLHSNLLKIHLRMLENLNYENYNYDLIYIIFFYFTITSYIYIYLFFFDIYFFLKIYIFIFTLDMSPSSKEELREFIANLLAIMNNLEKI
jgi:hypothetical protein